MSEKSNGVGAMSNKLERSECPPFRLKTASFTSNSQKQSSFDNFSRIMSRVPQLGLKFSAKALKTQVGERAGRERIFLSQKEKILYEQSKYSRLHYFDSRVYVAMDVLVT